MDCAYFDESGPGDRGEMECKTGSVINIESALYGRFSQTECSAGNGTYESWRYDVCQSSLNVTTHVDLKCAGQQSCTFRGMGAFETDPCPGTHKYVKIKYTCIAGGIKESQLPRSNVFHFFLRILYSVIAIGKDAVRWTQDHV